MQKQNLTSIVLLIKMQFNKNCEQQKKFEKYMNKRNYLADKIN